MKCLIPGCDRVAKSRGLCIVCYQAARNKVLAGKVTWEELVNSNLALVATHRGRAGGPFQDAFKMMKRVKDLPGQTKLFACDDKDLATILQGESGAEAMDFSSTADDYYGGTTLRGSHDEMPNT
jgi:hypothetical protein